MAKKLQNIKAVQQMLDGTHKFQTKKTIGFSDADATAKRNERHEIGDVWEEADPVTGVIYVIEQRDGFRIRKSKNTDVFQSVRDEIRSFPNCRKETCTCIKKNGTIHQLDDKMRKIHGMCFDCTIEMEHDLKKEGKYDEYEQTKIRENALAWLASAERDVELLKQTYTQAIDFVSNTDGATESWSAKMTTEEFEEKIQKEFDKFKQEFLKKINGEENND